MSAPIVIVLNAEDFAKATAAGEQLQKHGAERLLTGNEIAGLTSIPESWFLEQARLGTIPHRKFGKYVRFLYSEVLSCPHFQARPKA